MIPLLTSVGVTTKVILLFITEEIKLITGVGFRETTTVNTELVIQECNFALTW